MYLKLINQYVITPQKDLDGYDSFLKLLYGNTALFSPHIAYYITKGEFVI